MTIPNKALILVADGRKFLFLRNDGNPMDPTLRVEAHGEQYNPPTREQGTDGPGRVNAGFGNARSATEATDFHQLEEDRFAADAADMLRRRALAGDFEQLIVVAPPRTLGELRKHYHKEVESRLIQEVPKDLTDHPILSITKILSA